MRELFEAWSGLIRMKQKAVVTPVTGVTSACASDLLCYHHGKRPVTCVTAGKSVTGVTQLISERLQSKRLYKGNVTTVTVVTREILDSLSESEREAWEERVAIMENDGKMSREEAE